MTLILSNINFINDFYSFDLPDGSVLFLNKIDEEILSSTKEVDINAINIVVVDTEGEQHPCTNIIGIKDSYIKIDTKYEQYLGAPLNKDNMIYCTIEVDD